MKNLTKKTDKSEKAVQKFYEDIASEVTADFERRKKERLSYERQWQLNVNFLTGNQYCDVNGNFEIIESDKKFYWQSREVFNHIAPIIESRLAKFSRVMPIVSIRPKTDDDKDVNNATVTEKLVNSALSRTNFCEVVKKVNGWSEICGTGFYKIVWDNMGGNELGELDKAKVYEGEVKIIPVSPFEIYPDNFATESLQDLGSIIHAKAIPVKEVNAKYKVKLTGETVSVFNYQVGNAVCEENQMKDSVIVIEKYERPSEEFPNGRLITVAGGKVLYYGQLPYYDNGIGYVFPFIKQESQVVSGSFYGTSIIERLIPVQKAYNAVKNRKHEFLNRLTMGILTVEDGSIDVDDLAEEGLAPGKVLVYRQGSEKPELMDKFSIPSEFSEEEEKLLKEFVIISGVSDIASKEYTANVSSGTALEILIEQCNERLIPVAERIRNSYLETARQIINLYSMFLTGIRAVRYKDAFDKIKICYADKNQIEADEVYLENENELLFTPLQKKDIVMQLYKSGILNDDNGKIRKTTKEKVLTLLGYKDLDYQKGISKLQEEKANYENSILRTKPLSVEEIDDDEIHVEEHTRYLLSEYTEINEKQRENFYGHIKGHRERITEKEKKDIK